MNDRTNRVLVFSVAQIISIAVNFLVAPYLSRTLPKEDYSIYNQVIIIIGITSVLFSFGLQQVVFLFFSRNDIDQKKIVTTLQTGILIFGSLASSVLVIVSYSADIIFSKTSILYYIRICAPSILFTFINNYLISVLVYNGKTKYVAILAVLNALFTVTFLFVSLNVWNSVALALLFSQVAAPMLSIVIAFIGAKNFIIFDLALNWQAIKKIFKVSIPLYLTSLLGSTYIYFSAFFVIYVLGDIEYANYRNGAIEIPFISTVAFSVSSILLPDLNKYFHAGDLSAAFELKKKIINQCIYILYPVIIFFIIYHYEFIVSYFSSKYAESALVFAVYSVTCFVRINDYQDVLITAGKSSYILKSNLLYFITNIVLVMLLGNIFGIYGVAIAASISVFVLAFTLLKKDAKIFNVRIISFFEIRKILVITAISSLAALIIKISLTALLVSHHLQILLFASVLYFSFIYLYIARSGILLPSIVKTLTDRFTFLVPLITVKNK